MKSKKLLFSSLLSLGCIAAYIVFSSSAGAFQGVVGAAPNGCGSCHGNAANAATVINVTGIPGAGWVSGTVYPLTLTVTNPTMAKAGFDLTVDIGSLSGAPAGTTIIAANKEIHHTTPQTFTGNTATWTFNWTAPVAGTVCTVKVAGNAVNGNNQDSGDQWNKTQFTFNKAIATSVNDMDATQNNLYPNPSTGFVILNSAAAVSHIRAVSLNGSVVNLNAEKINDASYTINTSALSSGNYILLYHADGVLKHHRLAVK